MICFIELKGEWTDEQINDLFNMAKENYDLSFECDNLIKAHEAFPELNIMLTYGKNCGDYRRCFDYGFDIDADYKVATKEMVKEFHDKGLKVGVHPETWNVTHPEEIINIHKDYFPQPFLHVFQFQMV